MAELTVTCEDRTRVLTLNRPAKRNALSESLVEELLAAFADVPAGTDLVVLRGAGRSFSAGFDFTGLADHSDGDLLRRFVRIEQLLQTVHHAPYETLGLAHGPVFGAGADLLCACTHRVATPDATFRLPGLAFGLVLGTRRLVRRIGERAAREVQGTGAVLDAARAHRYGLLTAVADTGDWPRIQRDTARAAGTITPEARAVFHAAALADTRDADLADLVRSASVPGLRQRIQRFRGESAA